MQASPKFSTFICLSCAGTHRGLGVHISFVRSISMDAFKQNEILRMQHGGNKAWQNFYNVHIGTENRGKSFEDSSIKERYESDVGDEWKESLSAKVEDRDFDREAWKKEREIYKAKVTAANDRTRTQTPTGSGPRRGASGIASSTNSNTNSRSESPVPRSNPSQKEQKEAYFSQLGAANASRPDHLPPSQGGRLGGFGSSPAPTDPSQAQGPQADPIATLTQSFSWFATSLSRTAKTVNETYIQPTADKIASSDLAAQARAAAMQAGTGLQTSAKTATESFNRFVEGQEPNARSGTAAGPTTTSAGSAKRATEPERKDFWDSFGAATTSTSTSTPIGGETPKPKPKPSSIGTTAMKKGATTEGSGSAPLSSASTSAAAPTTGKGKDKGKDDGWDDW